MMLVYVMVEPWNVSTRLQAALVRSLTYCRHRRIAPQASHADQLSAVSADRRVSHVSGGQWRQPRGQLRAAALLQSPDLSVYPSSVPPRLSPPRPAVASLLYEAAIIIALAVCVQSFVY